MRAAGRAGVARVAFVVDSTGHADIHTFWVIESDAESFTRATRDFVWTARFAAAERDGVRVPHVYEMAVDFGFGDEPRRVSEQDAIIVRALGVERRLRP